MKISKKERELIDIQVKRWVTYALGPTVDKKRDEDLIKSLERRLKLISVGKERLDKKQQDLVIDTEIVQTKLKILRGRQ